MASERAARGARCARPGRARFASNIVFAGGLIAALLLFPGAAGAEGASILVPAVPDTFPTESPAAPFLVPGKTAYVDSSRLPEVRARAYLTMAVEMERAGQLSTALAAYSSAIALDTSLAGVAYRMGRIFQQLGEPGRAVPWFTRELKRDPRHVEAAIERGISLAQVGRHAQAIAGLRALTARRPSDDRAWSALGFAYHAAGRVRDAEAAMRRALELPPARASEHRDLGALLASLGREREARAQFRRAMAVDPRDAAAWVNLGNLERRAARNEQALEAYREAEARDSSQVLALRGQAQTLVALGRAREAEDAYHRWVLKSPRDFDARLEAIEYLVSEGRSDMALEIARGAVRLDRTSGDAHLMLGVALDAAGDKRGALAALRRAEVFYPSEAGRMRARHIVATLRAGAPDSLRALFAADSIEHPAQRR